jgi:hypothetical protein
MSWEELAGYAYKGLAFVQGSRKRDRDVFILKAITNAHDEQLGFSLHGSPLDLRQIEGMIAEAQLVAAGCHTGDSCYLEPLITSEEQAPYSWALKKVEWRYGLPALNHPHRLPHIEKILLEMTESRKLKYHPPNKWSIAT